MEHPYIRDIVKQEIALMFKKSNTGESSIAIEALENLLDRADFFYKDHPKANMAPEKFALLELISSLLMDT
jgi:hypothetical protein